MVQVIVHGCLGKMGKVICRLIAQAPDMSVCAGVDPCAGSGKEEGFPLYTTLEEVQEKGHVIIDFSTAAAVPGLLSYARIQKTPVVLCTTGLDGEMDALCLEAAKEIPLFKSANMSLGINLLTALLKQAASVLSPSGFDIEILEKHHNQKIDAPSGTALLLADAVNEGLDNRFDYVYDRSQIREKRTAKEIGIQSLRGGTIVGEHNVIFAGLDEVLEFNHIAHSKEVFGTGAVKAAKYLCDKGPGMYDMQDLMKEILG